MKTMKTKKKLLYATAIVPLIVVCTAFFAACYDKPAQDQPLDGVDYTDLSKNSYEVAQTTTENYKLYTPEKHKVKYGFIFFLGTAMSVSNYDNILEKIASAGIAVYVPANPFPDVFYSLNVFDLESVNAEKYFVGGHSQGGGAAVRYAYENTENTAGVILFSPLVSNNATLENTSLPSLYFEAQNDNVLTDDMQNHAKSVMNESCRYVLLEGAGHMCYGESSLLDGGGTVRDKIEIQNEITVEIISFLNDVING